MQRNLTGKQKAAILLIALGPEVSGRVLRQFKDVDIERLTREIFSMEKVSEDVKEEVISELHQMAVARNFVTSGGAQFARQVLMQALGEDRADEVIERVSLVQRNERFVFLREVDPIQLLSFIQGEQPQTIALIIAYVSPSVGASILVSLPPDIQSDVAMRIATMGQTSPETIESLERVLKAKLASTITREFSSVGGKEFLVRILNNVDRSTERAILDYLDTADPELAAEVRKLMFTFDDLVLLDDRSMQRVLRDVDGKDLALAVKGANTELQKQIYRNMSSRAAEMLKEEVEALGPVRLRNIEEAQQRIANIVRRLDEAEEIAIARGVDDVFV